MGGRVTEADPKGDSSHVEPMDLMLTRTIGNLTVNANFIHSIGWREQLV
jgi:hypothetical protein